MEIIQISEEQATEMLKEIEKCFLSYEFNMINSPLAAWKERGYIKKSAFDEFQDYYCRIVNQIKNNISSGNLNYICELHELALKAIEEVKNGNNTNQ
jgi:hypothetical protein